MNKKTKGYIKYGFIGGVIGLISDLALNLVSIDVYNFFYTPLNSIIPVSYVVPLVFIGGGIISGIVYKYLK